MKILLIGEFSAFHKNLKEGLVALGHDVTIAANGNGWKKIPFDIDLSLASTSIIDRLKYRKMLFEFSRRIKGYDVVQLVNPFVFPVHLFPYKYAMTQLKRNNKKLFLAAAGSDSNFWLYGRKKLKYGPFDDYLKYDLKKDIDPYEGKAYVSANEFCANLVDGIIPVMHEYKVSYEHCKNIRDVVPLPVNINEIEFNKNLVGDKLVVFHGLNRPGFKGTHYVEEAFAQLRQRYSDSLELIIDGKMPLDDYLRLMKRTDIVIDQTNSYSLGLNGIYALAMGKVVLGGAEQESLEAMGLAKSPVFNIRPGSEDIVQNVEYLLANKHLISDLSAKSRAFAEAVHGHVEVAKKYLAAWSS